jgi:hypothetical protein
MENNMLFSFTFRYKIEILFKVFSINLKGYLFYIMLMKYISSTLIIYINIVSITIWQ